MKDQPQTEGTSALALTPEQQLAQFETQELAVSRQGFDLRPLRIKISKETCQFVDNAGETFKELRGVVVFKQKTQGYWQKDVKIPACSSQDGVIGQDKECVNHQCISCSLNQWGSGRTEAGEETRGKACKTIRRMFVVKPGEALPSVVSFPPTSAKAYDEYFSGRVQRKITDVSREVIVTLHPEKGGSGFLYAVAEFKLGDEVPMEDRIEYAKMRDAVVAAAAKAGVTEEDYEIAPGAEAESVY